MCIYIFKCIRIYIYIQMYAIYYIYMYISSCQATMIKLLKDPLVALKHISMQLWIPSSDPPF